MKPDRYSALSGLLWAGIALVLTPFPRAEILALPLLVSPFIGILAGRLFRHLHSSSYLMRLIGSLGSLYLTASIFGAVEGFARFLGGEGSLSVVFNHAAGPPWGITITGLVLPLWLLAYLNHQFIAQLK